MDITGTENADTLNGTEAADVIKGLGGNDTISGLGGADDINGGWGADTIDAGAGNDLIRGERGENDVTEGGADFDVFRLVAHENQTIYRDSTIERYVEDTFDVGPGGSVRILWVGSVEGNVSSTITARSAELTGVESVEMIFSDADPYTVGLPGGTVIISNTDDRVTIPSLAGTALTGRLYFDFGSGDDVLVAPEVSNYVVALGGRGADRLASGLGDDELNGGDGNDTLEGGSGSDWLRGNAGDDTLDGQSGDDRLEGGTGNDIYVLGTGDIIVENDGEGIDLVLASVSATLAQYVENLTYTGSGSFGGTGNELANTIRGGAGSDALIGNDGNDVLVGLAGNNYLEGGNGLDTASYADAPGAVTVNLAARSASNGYGGTDSFNFVENVIGSASNDTLMGANDANTLDGGLGADYLIGFGGNDVLIGGPGVANALQGGLGDDLYVTELLGDTITEFAGEGVDTVQTALAAYRLGANLENLAYTGAGAFVGLGNELNNAINGGIGDDILAGFAGNNALNGGGGIDTANYSGASVGVSANLGGVATNNGYGGQDTLIGIERLLGSAFNDTLIGNGADNRLEGGAGADYLIGSGGNDRLIGGDGAANSLQGGLGDDVYVGVQAGDTLTEFAGEGTDTVETALQGYRLAGNFENLTYTGTSNAMFVGLGNTLDNRIVAGSGDDVLNGGKGSDVIFGGAGADIVVFDGDLGVTNIDTLADFQVGVDEIRLNSFIFSALPTGELSAAAFRSGPAAADADDRIIYNPNTGAIFYDMDGLGGQAAIKFAEVAPGLTALGATDFFVV